jgi:hypothetical protein
MTNRYMKAPRYTEKQWKQPRELSPVLCHLVARLALLAIAGTVFAYFILPELQHVAATLAQVSSALSR